MRKPRLQPHRTQGASAPLPLGLTLEGPDTLVSGTTGQYNVTYNDGQQHVTNLVVMNPNQPGTTIDQTGLLTVDPLELAHTLTLRATCADAPNPIDLKDVIITTPTTREE